MKRWLLLVLVLAAACSDGEQSNARGPGLEPQGPASPLDHPPFDAPVQVKSAGSRRLTVRQLSRSMSVALGKDANGSDITWKIGTQNGFDLTAGTLGEPDFIQT